MPGLPAQQYVWTEFTSTQPFYVRPAEVQVDPRNVIALLDDDHFYLSRLFRRIRILKTTLPHRPLLLFHPKCQWAIHSTDRCWLPFPVYLRLSRFPFISWLDRRRRFAGISRAFRGPPGIAIGRVPQRAPPASNRRTTFGGRIRICTQAYQKGTYFVRERANGTKPNAL